MCFPWSPPPTGRYGWLMHPLVRGACLVAVIAAIGGTPSTETAASATGSAVAGSVAPGSAPPPPTGLAPRQLLSCGPRSVTLEGLNGPQCAPLPDDCLLTIAAFICPPGGW